MTSHLTFEELIDGTGRHDGCPDCEAEAADWAAIRAAVRHQAGAPSAQVLPSVLANSTKTRRYLIPLSAVAAAAVLAAGSYGVVVALGHGAAPTHHADTTALTATGCTGFDLAGGTLTRVSGDDLVITTASGAQVTVTTVSTTAIYRETIGTLSDITDGRWVLVSGTHDGETITASSVGVLPGSATPAKLGGLGIGLASGTVTDAHDGRFTVIEADGTRVAVTTSGSVTVINTQRTSLTQLAVGEVTSAVGTAEGGGTLAATTVEQDAVPPTIWQKLLPAVHPPTSGLPSDLPTPAKPSVSLKGLGCSPAAITTAYLLAEHL
jgi:hypothetical protein